MVYNGFELECDEIKTDYTRPQWIGFDYTDYNGDNQRTVG